MAISRSGPRKFASLGLRALRSTGENLGDGYHSVKIKQAKTHFYKYPITRFTDVALTPEELPPVLKSSTAGKKFRPCAVTVTSTPEPAVLIHTAPTGAPVLIEREEYDYDQPARVTRKT